MKFSIVQYTTEEISSKSGIITSISKEIEAFLEDKDFGVGIDSLFIGLICVNPQFEQFFQPREKYTKSKRILEYSIKLDFESSKNNTGEEVVRTLIVYILDSIDNIVENYEINNFNVSMYKSHLKRFALEKNWIYE